MKSAFYQEVRKIYYNLVIVIDGAFKGVIGELVSVEMSLGIFPKCTIRVDYDNEITVLQHQIKKIEIEGENDMPTYSLSSCLKSLENIKIVNQLPKFDKNEIKDVRYNDPATIVFWKDGTKTVVKCQKDKGDTYNPELGLAMCIIKKMCDNKGNYNDVFNKWLPKESE